MNHCGDTACTRCAKATPLCSKCGGHFDVVILKEDGTATAHCFTRWCGNNETLPLREKAHSE